MTIHMSLDQTSNFNPSISITQHTESQSVTSPQLSIEASIESSQKQSQVHNLYTKLISRDLQTSKEKTQAQLDIQK